MRMAFRFFLQALLLCFASVLAFGSNAEHYVVTNDDVAPPLLSSGVSIYSIGTGGQLTYNKSITPSGFGIGGGFFGENRVRVVSSGDTQCIYMSQATSDEVAGIDALNGDLGGTANGSPTDGGTTNGIGLAVSSQYLYASFTDSNTIGTFQLQSGCSLTFVSDTPVAGLQGGVIDAMAIHGNMLIATYGDGSIESFNIAGGTPVSNGDEQNSTAAINEQFATYPSAIDITEDGHFAIFGDTSTASVVEVSDISSGQLTKTVVYQFNNEINSSNIMLSPDEGILYIAATEGDKLVAAFFDKTTGKIHSGCESGELKGYSSAWSYLGGLTLASNSGSGGMVYIAEFGAPSSIAMVQVTTTGRWCSLAEAPNSPVADTNSSGLLSIGTFPPRSF
jgi:hypothetical protein